MSIPPINEQSVLMVAVRILTAQRLTDDECAPLRQNRARDLAMDEAAQMAWELAAAVRKFNPNVTGADIMPLRRHALKPVPWDQAPHDAKAAASNDR